MILPMTLGTKDSMSQNRSGFRMVETDNGKIYAIGGFDGGSYLNTVENIIPLMTAGL